MRSTGRCGRTAAGSSRADPRRSHRSSACRSRADSNRASPPESAALACISRAGRRRLHRDSSISPRSRLAPIRVRRTRAARVPVCRRALQFVTRALTAAIAPADRYGPGPAEARRVWSAMSRKLETRFFVEVIPLAPERLSEALAPHFAFGAAEEQFREWIQLDSVDW